MSRVGGVAGTVRLRACPLQRTLLSCSSDKAYNCNGFITHERFQKRFSQNGYDRRNSPVCRSDSPGPGAVGGCDRFAHRDFAERTHRNHSPEIYGHFVEHLGGVVYDGIWVGEGSRVPNIGGIRKALVDALRKVKPGVIRWPGGCYADQYDWRDGIGPREKRPKRTNFWIDAGEWSPGANRTGPQGYEPNQMGTVEFARFCKLAGAQPYFAANVRSLKPLDFDQWAEYCNSPADRTTLGAQRAADGEREPLDVRYWGVGNESWGCGGNFLPEEYATEFRRFTAWVPGYGKPLCIYRLRPERW